VEAYNGVFDFSNIDPLLNDSARSAYSDEQFLGLITNDPIFGKTDARMFLELKPPFFKHTFLNKPDSLFIDSVVLVLDYVETYGDSTIPQTINVYELDQSNVFKTHSKQDSAYFIRQNNLTYSNLLGSATILPQSLNDSINNYQDTTSHQLRIRLSDAFGDRLLKYDTILASPNNAYYSDSIFKTKLKGFALQSVSGGNAIMGFDLMGANTKLAIYYKYFKNDPNKDTTVAYFSFAGNASSASANYIQRDYSGTPVLAAQGGATPDPIVYIQTTPGTFATLKIPALANLNNRVVHRAELIAEQVYHISDSMFQTPNFLYLDAYSPNLGKFRTIPYDLIFDGQAFNFGSFGVSPTNTTDVGGNVVRTWKFNLTRYVQHVVNDTEPLFDLRLSAPFYLYDQYVPPIANGESSATPFKVTLNPAPAKGRVRLHGNTDPNDPNPRRMRLRIIYSKL
jgi:hypothetical protein